MMTQRRIANRVGAALNVRELGSGPPVLFIHGWSLSGEVWDRQLGTVAAAGHRAVAVDLRGHGGSDAPLEGYDIDDLADDVEDVLRALDINAAFIVGWSLGGMVGLRLAGRRPDAVTGLALVASNGVAASRTEAFPFGVPAEEPLARILAAEHADRIALRRSAVGDPFSPPPSGPVLDWLTSISLQTPSWAASATMRTLLCTDQTDVLDEIRTDVTQIIGTRDPALSVRGARWLSERLFSRLVELDCGHYPMLEDADPFDAALLEAISVAHRLDA